MFHPGKHAEPERVIHPHNNNDFTIWKEISLFPLKLYTQSNQGCKHIKRLTTVWGETKVTS